MTVLLERSLSTRSDAGGRRDGQPGSVHRRSGELASPAACRLADDARHAPHVDADGREDPAGPRAKTKPLVARDAVSDLTWVDDHAHSIWRPHIRGRIRFHRSSAHGD